MVGVHESLSLVGHFRGELMRGQSGQKIGSGTHRVDHSPLGDRRMNIHAADCHCRQIGGECFDIDFAGAAAIERIANRRTELLEIDVVDSVADFLIASEAQPHGRTQ